MTLNPRKSHSGRWSALGGFSFGRPATQPVKQQARVVFTLFSLCNAEMPIVSSDINPVFAFFWRTRHLCRVLGVLTHEM